MFLLVIISVSTFSSKRNSTLKVGFS